MNFAKISHLLSTGEFSCFYWRRLFSDELELSPETEEDILYLVRRSGKVTVHRRNQLLVEENYVLWLPTVLVNFVVNARFAFSLLICSKDVSTGRFYGIGPEFSTCKLLPLPCLLGGEDTFPFVCFNVPDCFPTVSLPLGKHLAIQLWYQGPDTFPIMNGVASSESIFPSDCPDSERIVSVREPREKENAGIEGNCELLVTRSVDCLDISVSHILVHWLEIRRKIFKV